jgi:signal transduction histidine kinase
VAFVCLAFALLALATAFEFQRDADQPVGEGELFFEDAATASASIAEATARGVELEEVVRHVRNDLTVEAVSIVAAAGAVEASSSSTLEGTTLENPFLLNGAEGGRFVALATPIVRPLHVGGVEEWEAGTVLYEVLAPLGSGERSVLLHYDVAELLERRARESGVQTETLQLIALGALMALLAGLSLLGRARTARRYSQMEHESHLLRQHSAELAESNSQLSEARRAAERALHLAEEKNRIRAEFVLMINHELRTPLTSVVTGAELLRSDDLGDEQRAVIVDTMVADGRRLQDMIGQILAVARIENRGLAYELGEVSAQSVCDAVTSALPWTVSEHADDHGDYGGATVLTDRTALVHVITSLANNARTHGANEVRIGCTDQLGFDPMHEVGMRPEQAIYFTVADDGPGIAADFLPRVFEKFEKNSFSPGTGLGLYMARMMVEAVEGSLAVHSSPTGTTFAIAVPTAGAELVIEPVP